MSRGSGSRPTRARIAAVIAIIAAVIAVAVVPLLTLTAPAAAAEAPRASAAARPGEAVGGHAASVVVVGVPGLRWDDVTAIGTPHLWALTGRGAVGALSVRAGASVTCPVDGWVTLGAGNRARGPDPGHCRQQERLLEQRVPAAMRTLTTENDGLLFGATVGALGEALRDAGRCATAVGAGAALAAADPAGQLRLGTDPAVAATYRACPLTVVGSDAFTRPGSRSAAAAAVDRLVAAVDAARPPGSVLVVAGISETAADPSAHLHVVIAAGGEFDGGRLVSASTRRAPYTQLIDLAPTVLDQLGLPVPRTMVGQPLQPAGGRSPSVAAEVAHLRDLDREARTVHDLVPAFFAILVVGQAVLYLAAAIALRRQRSLGRRRALLTATRGAAVVGEAGLVATFLADLVPWWRADHPLPAILAAVAVPMAVVGAVALLGPWRRRPLGPPAVVSAVTFGVLAVDLVVGAPLQIDTLAGYSPLVAGRFAGIGNVAYAVFATAALLTAAAATVGRSRRVGAALVVLVGLVAVVIDGAPGFGDDFGGVLALVPAVALLAMWVGGIRVTWRRVLATAVGAVAAVSAFALLDYSRPPQRRSHLGRFVAQLLDGTAGTVVHRKAAANVHLLTHSVLTLLIPVAVVVVAFVLLRPYGGLRAAFTDRPALRYGLLATGVMALVGLLVNDSGVAIPVLAMTVAIPFAIAASADALRRRLDAGADPTPAVSHPVDAPHGVV